jgi:HSP20 family protein
MPASFARDWNMRVVPSAPRIDTSETSREVTITADVPGMDEKDLDVCVTDNSVTIKGVKKREIRETDARKSERFYGTFERSLTLPCRVECEKADASLKNGVLTIVVPKSQIASRETKKLRIKTQ